jgi:hypothetical protein
MKRFYIPPFWFLIIMLVISGVFVFVVWPALLPATVPTINGVTMLMPSVKIPAETERQVLEELAQSPAAGIARYAVTSLTRRDGYTIVSVAGFAATQEDPWNLEDALWLGTVTLAPGGKGGIVQEQSNPADGGLPARGMENIGGGAGNILPWLQGTQAMYGPLGVHDCGFSLGGWKAVDLFPINHQVYAAQGGEVSYVCRDSTQISIRVGENMYVHLVDSGIEVGDQFEQGDYIGTLVPGTFDDTCGHADQQPENAHVHFCFLPYDNIFTADGYSLDTNTSVWTKGAETYEPTDYLTATWENAGVVPDMPAAMGGNFWDSIMAGIMNPVEWVMGMFPPHEYMGIADKTTDAFVPSIALFYPTLSLFNMTTIMWVVLIIMLLEALRIILSLILWIKKVLPDIVGFFI